MRFYQVISYFFIVIGIYIGLFLLELGFLTPFLDFFLDNYKLDILVFGICLVIINPVITYFLAEKIPFKIHGLMLKDGLKQKAKQDVEIE